MIINACENIQMVYQSQNASKIQDLGMCLVPGPVSNPPVEFFLGHFGVVDVCLCRSIFQHHGSHLGIFIGVSESCLLMYSHLVNVTSGILQFWWNMCAVKQQPDPADLQLRMVCTTYLWKWCLAFTNGLQTLLIHTYILIHTYTI
jgi:hypothetical protein